MYVHKLPCRKKQRKNETNKTILNAQVKKFTKTLGERERYVFACFWKEARHGVFRRADGSEFQTVGGKKLKER